MKRHEDKLTSLVRIPFRESDKAFIDETARREDPRGETASWCRRVLLEAAWKLEAERLRREGRS